MTQLTDIPSLEATSPDTRLVAPEAHLVTADPVIDAPARAIWTVTAGGTWQRLRPRRLRPAYTASLFFLVIAGLSALFPSLLAPHDPILISAAPFLRPSWAHLLGTDDTGRDTLSRLIYGARPALELGLGATAIGLVGGAVIGTAAGLGRRFVDGFLMRLVDTVLAVPDLLLALVIVSMLGTGLINTLFAIGFAQIPHHSRMIRAQAKLVARSPYVEAAKSLGVAKYRLILRHVIPNAIRPVIVLATLSVGTAIIAGASLSFLGLGVEPPAPDWGAMLANGLTYLSNDFWQCLVPGIAVACTVLSITIIGRDLKRRSEGRVLR